MATLTVRTSDAHEATADRGAFLRFLDTLAGTHFSILVPFGKKQDDVNVSYFFNRSICRNGFLRLRTEIIEKGFDFFQ